MNYTSVHRANEHNKNDVNAGSYDLYGLGKSLQINFAFTPQCSASQNTRPNLQNDEKPCWALSN